MRDVETVHDFGPRQSFAYYSKPHLTVSHPESAWHTWKKNSTKQDVSIASLQRGRTNSGEVIPFIFCCCQTEFAVEIFPTVAKPKPVLKPFRFWPMINRYMKVWNRQINVSKPSNINQLKLHIWMFWNRQHLKDVLKPLFYSPIIKRF